MPPALLEEVFALNEELDEIREQRAERRAGRRVEGAARACAQPIEAKRAEHEAQLAGTVAMGRAGDAGANDGDRRAILEALRDRFLERNYISNLLAGIEREISS